LGLLSAFKKAGVVKVITTPHIKNEYYPNTPEKIKGELSKLREAADCKFILAECGK